jgi:hypothetical protein
MLALLASRDFIVLSLGDAAIVPDLRFFLLIVIVFCPNLPLRASRPAQPSSSS